MGVRGSLSIKLDYDLEASWKWWHLRKCLREIKGLTMQKSEWSTFQAEKQPYLVLKTNRKQNSVCSLVVWLNHFRNPKGEWGWLFYWHTIKTKSIFPWSSLSDLVGILFMVLFTDTMVYLWCFSQVLKNPINLMPQ